MALFIALTIAVIYPFGIEAFQRFSEYALFIVLGFLALALFFLTINQRSLMTTAFVCCGVLSLFLKGESNASLVLPRANKEAKFKISHINLSSIEGDYEEVFRNLDTLQADILSFQEVTPDWHAYLKQNINDNYPYDHSIVRIDLYGKAIYSKLPIENKSIRNTQNVPMLECDIATNDTQIKLVSCYVSETRSRSGIDFAQRQLQMLTGIAQQSEFPMLVVGDFNLVYWDPEVRSFRNNSGLNNSRRTVSLSSFTIPYDHIFYSNSLECTGFDEIRSSDQENHIGIWGTYQFRYGQ